MKTFQFIIEQSAQRNCTPSVVVNALAGSKWPHSMLKHFIRDDAEWTLGERRLSAPIIASLRRLEDALWRAFSGAENKVLPLP